MTIQEKEVPDQTALVWRIDLSQLHQDHSHMGAMIKSLQHQLAELQRVNALHLRDIKAALDTATLPSELSDPMKLQNVRNILEYTLTLQPNTTIDQQKGRVK